MEEIKLFGLRFAIASVAAILIGAACWGQARRKGRDTVGWFLLSFFPSLAGLLAFLVAFPDRIVACLFGIVFTILVPATLTGLAPIETPGQTKRCQHCGRILPWKLGACPSCGAEVGTPALGEGVRVRRPLRSCFLYSFLFILLVLVVFGLIGYFCVPA